MPRSIDQLLAQAAEFADRFEQYEPAEDERGEPALQAVRRAAYRRSLLEQELLTAVRGAREAGATWTSIGQELGTTGEAARQRYGNLLSGAGKPR